MFARLLPVFVIAAAPTAAAQSFFDAPWRASQTGTPENGRFTLGLTTADVNGDGRPDAITAQNVFHEGLRVLLNQGSAQGNPATFEDDGLLLPLSRGAWEVVAIDLDLDGDADLAAPDTDLNWNGSTVAVFRNNGNGTFAAAQSFAAGNGSTGITAADLDGDLDVDLVVTNYGYLGQGTTITVLRNNVSGGNATFAAPTSYTVPASPARVRAGDLDGDTDVDLVVSHDGTLASVLFNAGNGTFGAAVTYDYAASAGEPGMALLDIDGDGDTDAIFAGYYDQNVNDGRLALLRNNGSGVFTTQLIPYGAPYNNLAVELAAADLDGDGRDDVVGAQQYESGFIVFRDNDAGSLQLGAMYASVQNVSGEAGATGVALADVDGDGDPDVLTTGRIARLLSVHENLGLGQFPELPIQGRGILHTVLDLGDVDGDGDLDAVTSHGGASASDIAVYQNDGSGGYTESQRILAPRAFAKFRELDGDGVLDLLFVSAPTAPPYDFFTAHGNGNGTFGPAVRHSIGLCGIGHPNAVDLDADGDLDVVNTENGGCPSIPLSGRRLFVSLNNGDATFQPPMISIAGAAPFNTTAGDYNEDGHVDLATASQSISAVVFGNGDGTFQQPDMFLPSGELGSNILTLDLNVDGNLDLATLRDYSPDGSAGSESELVILFGNGAGGFAPVAYPHCLTQDFREWLASGDVDADGDTDILIGGVNDALVFLNDGAGVLSSAGRFGIGAGAFGMHYAEVTGDGRSDLVALCSHELPPWGGEFGIVVVSGLVSKGPDGIGTPLCFGDGSTATQCPCANLGTTGHGCENSASTGGALLTASGTTSPDTVVLTSSGELPIVLSVFLQGDANVPNGILFGDGLRCVSGNLKRLYTKNAIGGVVSAPGTGDPSITVRSATLGDTIAPGSTRYYQVYYRDPSFTFCPTPSGDTFNISNGLAILW